MPANANEIFSEKKNVSQIYPIGVEQAKSNPIHRSKNKDILKALDLHTEHLNALAENVNFLETRVDELSKYLIEWEFGSYEKIKTEGVEKELESLKSQLAKQELGYKEALFEAGFCDTTFTYHIKRPITTQDVEDLKNYYESISEQKYVKGFGVTIVLDNTAGQDPNVIKMFDGLDCFVNFNVIGGLDRNKKQKYNEYKYLERNTYSPTNLYKDIKEFERIESLIDDSWSDRQKALFVYMSLMRTKKFNDKNYCTRSLDDICRKSTVCAGFSLIYKEMMDRLGIECEYQNKKDIHAWNVLTIDGKQYGLDLSSDTYRNEGENRYKPIIKHFGLESTENFYDKMARKLDNENDEIRFNLSEFSKEDLERDIEKISKRLKQIPVPIETKSSDIEGHPVYREDVWEYGKNKIEDKEIYYSVIDDEINNDFRTVVVGYLDSSSNKNMKRVFFVDKKLDLDKCLNNYTLGKAVEKNDFYIGEHKESVKLKVIHREDGSTCYITDNPATNSTLINKYCVFEWKENKGLPTIASYRVMTESNNLTDENSPEEDSNIANVLLSKNRLKERVDFCGYVGHLEGERVVTDDGTNKDLNPFNYDSLNM